jgi:hypothetical protein
MPFGQSWHPLVPAAAALAMLLSGCVGTTTQLAPLPAGAIEAEQEKQQELAIEENEREQDRLDSLAYPILAHSTSLCPNARAPLLGLRVATIHNYEKERQPAAARVLGLTDTLTVTGVVPGGPAAIAGLLPGDRLIGMGSRLIPAGREATKTFAEAFAEFQKPEPGRLSILFSRAGEQQTASMSLSPVCAYGTVVVNTGELNAFADGERIFITSTMMRFASDEELRVVIAHEFAHDAMEHMKARRKNSLFGGLLGAIADIFMATRGINTGGYYTSQYAKLGALAFSQDFEREADYVGLYALALSDIPLETAPRFWRHMAQADPKSIQLAYTHPTTAERFVRMEQAVSEIEQKRANQVALLPELKSGKRAAQPREGSEPLLAASARPQPEPAKAPEALAVSPAPPEPAAYRPMASAEGTEPTAGPTGVTRKPPWQSATDLDARPVAELTRDPRFLQAIDDVKRLGILVEYGEVRAGVLAVAVGPGFGNNSSNYNLGRLLAAYRGTVEWNQRAALELWQGERKIGEYTADGIRLSAEQGTKP